MGGIRAIIFDLDNTLWDVWPVIVRATWRQFRGTSGWDKTSREPLEADVSAAQ